MKEKLHPETAQFVGLHYITPDYYHPLSFLVNQVLSLTNADKRAILVLHEDAPRAWGILTQEEAIEMANRLAIDDETGNFTDPELSEFSRKIQEKLGLI